MVALFLRGVKKCGQTMVLVDKLWFHPTGDGAQTHQTLIMKIYSYMPNKLKLEKPLIKKPTTTHQIPKITVFREVHIWLSAREN